MKTSDRKKLIETMFPADLAASYQPQPLKELVIKVCDDLESGGEPEYVVAVVITVLQLELVRARQVIRKLNKDVNLAETVFADTCDCGECGPCKRRPLFRKHVEEGTEQIARCNLAIGT